MLGAAAGSSAGAARLPACPPARLPVVVVAACCWCWCIIVVIHFVLQDVIHRSFYNAERGWQLVPPAARPPAEFQPLLIGGADFHRRGVFRAAARAVLFHPDNISPDNMHLPMGSHPDNRHLPIGNYHPANIHPSRQ